MSKVQNDSITQKEKITAKLFLETLTGTHITVRAYYVALQQIAQGEQVTTINLLNAPSFDVEFNDFHIITI